jgi:hypothetical protein
LKDEQFLANPFNVINYLSDGFRRFLGVSHDANRLLFCARKFGTLAVRITPLFPSTRLVGFPESKQILYAPEPIA